MEGEGVGVDFGEGEGGFVGGGEDVGEEVFAVGFLLDAAADSVGHVALGVLDGGSGVGFGGEVLAEALEAPVFPQLGEGEVCGYGFDGGDEGDVLAFIETAEVFAEGQVAE